MTKKRKLLVEQQQPSQPAKRSKEAYALRLKEEVELFRQKIQDHTDRGGTWEHLRSNTRFHQGVVEMECVKCRKFLPRTTDFFTKSLNNFEQSKPGIESLHNSETHPCNLCYREVRKKFRNTPKGYLASLTGKAAYPLLDPSWTLRQLAKQNNKGYFTGFPLSVVPGNWQVSIHNLDPNAKEHRPENCVLDIFELNVNQGGPGRAIPDLREAIMALFEAFVVNYDAPPLCGKSWLAALKQTPNQLGITGSQSNPKKYVKQVNEIHLPAILSVMILNNHFEDKRKKRYKVVWKPFSRSEKIKLERAIVQAIINQGCRCAYSGVPLTWTNGWHRLSFERIDNRLPHFENGRLDNIVFICRILNGPAQMSRAKMCELMLKQTAVAVPEHVRVALEDELR
jgi:hypothetical protein